jgi:hypothetical protein
MGDPTGTGNNNTRRTLRFTINGVTKSLKQWTQVAGLNYGTVTSRIKRGVNIQEALSK